MDEQRDKKELRTTELLNKLNATDAHGFKNYLADHPEAAKYTNLRDYFNDYFKNNPDINISDVIKRSNLDRSYAYQIINGRKPHPGKYKLAVLCMCAGMTLKETQRALTISGNAILYARNPQDAAFIVCINNNCDSAVTAAEFFAHNGLAYPNA